MIRTLLASQEWVEPRPLATILLGSLAMGIASQVSINLPYTTVPFTMQTFALFLLAGTLGAKRAVQSVFAYLVEGTCGMPVFAGGVSNPFWFIDAKAGFLISFLVAAYVMGNMLAGKKSVPAIFFALLVGQCLIFFIGTVWLSLFVGPVNAYLFGVVPFLVGAAFKISSACLILRGARGINT